MPFNSAGFATAAASKPGLAPSTFTYKSTDALNTVRTNGYFNGVRELLHVSDLIYAAQVDGNGALVAAGWLVVKDKSATNVDTTDATAATVTDTD